GSGTMSTLAETTDTKAVDVIESGNGRPKLSNDARSCLSSVRNFAQINAPNNSSGECAVFRDCNDASAFSSKHFYPYSKCDSGSSWEDLVKVQRTNAAATGASESLSGSCKFIKDEKEQFGIMDAPGATFDPPAPGDVCALESCCEPERKQLDQGEVVGLSSPHFLMDLNQNQTQTDSSRCPGSSGKALINFDGNTLANAQLMMYKSEAPRWQVQSSPTDQFWCQSTGVNEDPFNTSSFDGIQNQILAQRNPSPMSAFPGLPPQRLCVICGDEASGCHYGVLTCGSCKVFFKRAVEGHHSYLCAGRNDCIVDKIRRKNCPACRLRKCYQAGMMLGGRKLKRFGALKALGLTPALMFQSQLAMSSDTQALTSMSCIPGFPEMQLSPQILSILENIEPETVHSGFENIQPDVPHLLLSSLNRLCEKQLLWIVKWSKSLPGFRNLHINDQMTLIQYSWMNLMVFSLGWRSFQNVTSEYLYFAPDLILSQDQMRRSPIYDLCLAIQFIPQEFANLQVTREEFLCMKAIILLNTVPLEGLKSQTAFDEMRQSYIRELTKVIHMKEKGMVASSQRLYHLTKLMDSMHEIVKKVNLFCLSTFIQADSMKVEFPEMMSEVIASQLPKVLAGMVRPLLFHHK
uniref:Progesterone receptor n=1 Tax=Gouania willdenowi TaxID=441366 RepID=A0A8C5G9A5_GOUWI